MKIDMKKILPHIIAIGVFMVVTLLYCKPALEGKVLQQHDIVNWKGMSHDAELYRTRHGEYPLWTNGIFSGMPSYQIAFASNNYVPYFLPHILGLWMPEPFLYFFLACLCFYLLTQVLRLNPYLGIMGALSFAFATYNPVIISVGHHTKMMTIAMMPAFLAAVLLVFNRKYWLGTGLLALFSGAMVAMNHAQIIYYAFIIVGFMSLSFAIVWIRQKEYTHLAKAAALTVFAIAVGIASNAVVLLTTYDYSKASIRGGSALKAATADSSYAAVNSSGLDSSYAMSYSMSIPEPLVLAVPRLFGGSNADPLPEDGKVYEALSEASAKFGPEAAQQLSRGLGMYWGGIGSTSGQPYSGAIVCFLAVFGLFVVSNRYRWWILASLITAVVLSWGGYFFELNGLLLKYLPFYNKFRAPSMIMVIPQVLLPMLAVLTLDKLSSTTFDVKANWPKLKAGLIGLILFAALLIGFYLTADFISPMERSNLKQINAIPDQATKDVYKSIFNALAEDRKQVALGDITRTLAFALLAGVFVWLIIRRKLKPIIGFVALAFFSLTDLLAIDSKYLGSDTYVDKIEYDGKEMDAELVPTSANLQIQQDKGIYRVFDNRQYKMVNGQAVGANTFSDATQGYHHNMVNGYHAAKLSIYQDLIENQIAKGNPQVFDMLNTKYLLENGATGDTVRVNPNALGPAWFVKHVKYVNTPREEMDALDNFNPRDTAIALKQFEKTIGGQPVFDSAATIEIANYDNNVIEYAISTKTNQFVVLSEIYYDRGWKAFADGKEIPIAKVNYVLRGVSIPAGTKKLELKFEPSSYSAGKTVTNIAQYLAVLMLLAGLYMEWRNSSKRQTIA